MSKVEKLSPDKNGMSRINRNEPINNAQVKPSMKPNFGDDDEEDGVEFVGNQNPSHLFKS